MKILLICGGPSKECNISLNSTRSIYDHISKIKNVLIKVIFISHDFKKYHITEKELYSNTASDFKYLLSHSDHLKLNENQFIDELKKFDLVFPLIHGKFGEDGLIQDHLEKNNIPFIASDSKACRLMYNKKIADEDILIKHNFYSIPKLFISINDIYSVSEKIKNFFDQNKLTEAIIKPVEGGSSIGVKLAKSFDKSVDIATELLLEYGEIVIEKKCEGKEFTIIVLEYNNRPVALIPSEIENEGIFDTRKKYLSTEETVYYCPPRPCYFSNEKIMQIREQACKLFSIANAHDFLRIDGFLLNDGQIYFSDFNPISGMEQNSFIFQQSTRIGFTHASLLIYIINNAMKRYNLNQLSYSIKDVKEKSIVNILLGGVTSEKNISLMSGGNVWLKLLSSDKYTPIPYLFFMNDNDEYYVQKVPYPIMLNHTTKEMEMQLENDDLHDFDENNIPLYYDQILIDFISYIKNNNYINNFETSSKKTLKDFIYDCKKNDEYIFIGLHGGFGENGELQALLEKECVPFSASGSVASELCMDKFKTGNKVNDIKLDKVRSCRKMLIEVATEMNSNYEMLWNEIKQELNSTYVVAKPNDDGCSTGVVVLHDAGELKLYFDLFRDNKFEIPENTFKGQREKILFEPNMKFVLFEEYIQIDTPKLNGNEIEYSANSHWIELTVGVLEKNGCYNSFLPSLSVAESGNGILSLEEKFQGGTGINMTPPPEDIIDVEFVDKIKFAVEQIAKAFEIKDYCRIDIFANNLTEEIIIIELNTLPGLTPSTVLFQQAAKENLSPLDLIEKIIM